MKVIDFNEEEQEIKRDIERARQNIKEVEDLSDFDSKPKKEKKNKKDEEEEPLTKASVAKEIISVIINVLV